VKKNDVLLSLETDKATVEVVAESNGKLSTSAKNGETVKIGASVGSIDSDAAGAAAAAPAPAADSPSAKPAPAPTASAPSTPPPMPAGGPKPGITAGSSFGDPLSSAAPNEVLSPAVRRVVDERGLDPASISGSGKDGRITKFDAESAEAKAPAPAAAPAIAKAPSAPIVPGQSRRVPMTTIRKRIAQRLVEAQHNAAILTTFNEVDMTAVMNLRAKYKEDFQKKHGVGLGFMGFFVKACIHGLKQIPAVNAFIDGDDLIYHDYVNVGVAVGTEKGLIVPVIKNAEQLSLAGIELAIRDFAGKAKEGKISPNDLGGGTFTISNGGTYGSLMSTPILNPPQSAILGMHKIEDRPVVVNKEIVIRPMMYLAVSYDHRVIDGKEAVTFLVKVKEAIEDPQRLVLEV
jgi:2-oxoglutarate dehydrogenase E2 component (dihydrolipoamide succinyltransferase)